MPEAWRVRHNQAFDQPRSEFERALVDLYNGLQQYAEGHRERYESQVGDDGVLGPAWAKIASGFLELLNGETGRLDAGTLDKWVRDLARENGFEEEI